MAPNDSFRRFGLNCSGRFTSVDNTSAPNIDVIDHHIVWRVIQSMLLFQ